MAEVPGVFDQPGAAFVLLPAGKKFPPIEKEWQARPHSFDEAIHHTGNVGLMAGGGFIGLDQDDPAAFAGLALPPTTTWETRPGRYGMWFKTDDVAEALTAIGKKPDQAQLKLFKDGRPCGEVKTGRSYQTIPPSYKFIDPVTGNDVEPGKGDRVDYRLLDGRPPATISLCDLLGLLQAIGITFSSRLDQNTAKLEAMGREARQKRAESDEQRARRYAEAALDDEVRVLESSPVNNRNNQLNLSAFALGQFVAAGVLSEAEVIRKLSRAAMSAGLEPAEIRATIASGLGAGEKHPREIPKPENAPTRQLPRPEGPGILGTEPATDGGNAQRLIRLHQNNIKYCHTFKKWMVWDGHRWKIDGDGSTYRLCDDVIREIYSEAANCIDSRDRQEWGKFAIRSDSGRGYRDMLFLASFNRGVAITSEQLDTNPLLFNTQDLTIDLKTFEAREPSREDLITKVAGAIYDPSAKCPIWLRFLDKIFQGDEDLISYVQRAIGYSLTGSMVEQVYFFCHGTGANGKSVFLATLRALLGDYAKQASFDTFLVQHTAKVRNDLAALAGARIITASEAEEGSRLSMQVIKSWTGGDPITARFLFGEDFTFRPVGKIWLAANTKPTISERNYAAWRRVHLIPFLVTIAPEEQDRELEKKLLDELQGILVWALEGLKQYHRIGLQPPEAVKAATDAYRRENDSIEAFLSECCEVRKLAICKNSDLFNSYLVFCRMSGEETISQKKFSAELANIPGIRKTRDRNFGILWHGLELSKEWAAPSQSLNEGVKDNRYAAQDVKDVKPNPQSFETSLHEGNFSEMPSHPSRPSPDSDFEKSNPSRPGELNDRCDGCGKNGAQPAEPQEEPPKSGPHPRRDEPTPAPEADEIPRPYCYLAKVRGAAIIEYGYNGWVDPAKIAKAAGILECQACRALIHLGYVQIERRGGGIGFRQKTAGASS